MYVSAIVVAAGRGVRLKSKTCKPLVKINSQSIIIYSLSVLNKNPEIKEIILAVNPQNLSQIATQIKRYRINKVARLVLGGRLRQDSVKNALAVLHQKTKLVLIHDAARPLVDGALVSAAIKAAKRCGAAIVGVPVKATIKEVHGPQSAVHSKIVVKKTLDRNRLWEVQTPQVFKKELLLKAYKKCAHEEVTDDAALVEKLGAKVVMVRGEYSNIKITTPEDLIIAKSILTARAKK